MKNITKALFLSVLCLSSMSFGMSRLLRVAQVGATKAFQKTARNFTASQQPTRIAKKAGLGAGVALAMGAAANSIAQSESIKLTSEQRKELESLPTEVDVYGDTRLMEACRRNMSIAVIRYLVEVEGEDVNAVDNRLPLSVNSPMRYAVKTGSIETINLLASKGARINNQFMNDLKAGSYTFGYMPLLTYAAAYQTPEVVECLIKNGAQEESSMGICRRQDLDGTTKGMCTYWTDLRMPMYSYFPLDLATQLKRDDIRNILIENRIRNNQQ